MERFKEILFAILTIVFVLGSILLVVLAILAYIAGINIEISATPTAEIQNSAQSELIGPILVGILISAGILFIYFSWHDDYFW